MNWNDKNVLVIGTGVSGIAAADLLIQVGAKVILFDGNEQVKKEAIETKLRMPEKLTIVIGTLEKEMKEAIEYVVLSPGVPIDNPMVNELREAGKVILGEIELAYTLS